jgi:hypothetical protein
MKFTSELVMFSVFLYCRIKFIIVVYLSSLIPFLRHFCDVRFHPGDSFLSSYLCLHCALIHQSFVPSVRTCKSLFSSRITSDVTMHPCGVTMSARTVVTQYRHFTYKRTLIWVNLLRMVVSFRDWQNIQSGLRPWSDMLCNRRRISLRNIDLLPL